MSAPPPSQVTARHLAKFSKWQSLAPASTRALCQEALRVLVPAIQAQGFTLVALSLKNPDWPISGRELCFEREIDGDIEAVTLNFDKYRRPRFQVQLSRRNSIEPYKFVRSANLVANPNQYYHFWGKPWWLPELLWSPKAAARTVAKVSQRQGQAFAFLSSGARGSSIGQDQSTSIRTDAPSGDA